MVRRVALPVIGISFMACAAMPAKAGLPADALAEVALVPPAGARIPPDLALTDETGAVTRFAAAQGGRTAVVVLADYTCRVLCGTAVGLAAAALRTTATAVPLLVLPIDPRDTPRDAAALHRTLPDTANARFYTADAATIARAEAAIGYSAQFDAETDSYAHPLGILVLTQDGHVSRALAGLAIEPETLRLALVEASAGRIGSLTERVRLFCYGFDAARGVWTAMVKRMLTLGSVATLLALGGFLVWSWRRNSRRAGGQA